VTDEEQPRRNEQHGAMNMLAGRYPYWSISCAAIGVPASQNQDATKKHMPM
jgi:hypothetical protein